MPTDRCENTSGQKYHAKRKLKRNQNTRTYVWKYNECGT